MLKKINKLIYIGVLLAILMFSFVGCQKDDSNPYYNDISSSTDKDSQSNKDTANEEAYASPINFEMLQKENPDAYAWIKVPGTDIDFPIFQSVQSDEYYLRTNRFHKYDEAGELFTQTVYNPTPFDDLHTVIYGHNMYKLDGGMFSQLALYKEKEFFNENNEIIVYFPDKKMKYEIFAFYTWTDEHLIYEYPTDKPQIFENYLNKILTNTDMTANIKKETSLDSSSKIITLSTCVSLDSVDTTGRYLLQAVLVE